MVDQLAHIDLQLAQAVGKNLGIELTDEQRSITPPPDVNGLKKDPTLSLYAIPSGDVKGRVVAVLLNDRPVAKELLTLLKALKAHGVHAKLLYSRMGKVQADDVPSCRWPGPLPGRHRLPWTRSLFPVAICKA